MTDLSNIKRVVVVDGLGRKSTTVNAENIDIYEANGTLHITHDGDTTYSTEGTQRWLS